MTLLILTLQDNGIPSPILRNRQPRRGRWQREALRAADPDVSEARLAASVKYLVLDERKAFQEADNLAKTLHGRFKALQSALSFLKSELRM